MKERLLEFLACPDCAGDLRLVTARGEAAAQDAGDLRLVINDQNALRRSSL